MSDRSNLENQELTLRDHLAIGRTTLANERTLLAYIRTAMAAFIAGVSLIKFFDSIIIEIIGWIFVPSGIITIIVGLIRFQKQKESIPEKYKVIISRKNKTEIPK